MTNTITLKIKIKQALQSSLKTEVIPFNKSLSFMNRCVKYVKERHIFKT